MLSLQNVANINNVKLKHDYSSSQTTFRLKNQSKCTEEDSHTVPAFACDSKITTLASSLFTYTSESTA